MSEGSNGLNFVYDEAGPLEKIGIVGSIPLQHLMAGTWDSVGKEIPRERIEELKERFKNVEWQGNVEVHLNKSSIMRQLERLFGEDRKLSLFTRTFVGVPTTLIYGVLGKLAHWNFYNPYSETVQLYNENKYINLAKIGSAESFNQIKNPILKEVLALMNAIPGVGNTIPNTIGLEKAWEHIDESEKDYALKILGSSFVSDVVNDSIGVGVALALIGGVDFITSTLIAGGFALTTQGILELRRRIRENKNRIFDKDSKLDLLSKEESLTPIVKEQLIHLAT